MKKVFLFTVLSLIPLFGISQSKRSIDDFLGIKFGSDAATVKSAIAAKGGKLSETSENSIEFSDIMDGKRKVLSLTVKFYNDMAYFAMLTYPNYDPSKIKQSYTEIANDLDKKYGKGVLQKAFIPPYKEGDGHESEAIKSGNGSYITTWTSTVDRSSVKATFLGTNAIFVIYEHPPM